VVSSGLAAQLEQHSWDQAEADQGMTQRDDGDGAGQTGIGFDARIGSGARAPHIIAFLHTCTSAG